MAGMFGNWGGQPWGIVADPNRPSPIPQQPVGTGFNKPGGWAEKLGAVSDLLGNSNRFGQQRQNAAEMAWRQQQLEAQEQQRNKPQYHFGERGAVDQIDPTTGQITNLREAAAPVAAPTELERNYEYLKTIDPAAAETYLRAQANPQTLMTNPATGQLGFYPKGGIPSARPSGDLPAVGTVMADPRKRGGAGPVGPQTFR